MKNHHLSKLIGLKNSSNKEEAQISYKEYINLLLKLLKNSKHFCFTGCFQENFEKYMGKNKKFYQIGLSILLSLLPQMLQLLILLKLQIPLITTLQNWL